MQFFLPAEELLILVDLCNLGQETSQNTVEGLLVLKKEFIHADFLLYYACAAFIVARIAS